MAEWFPGQNPDFSTLGEVPASPEKPSKTPEFLDDDDDEDVEEAPKTIRDYLEKKDEKSKETAESEEENADAAVETEPEPDADEATESDEEAEEESASREMSDNEVQEAAVEIVDSRAASAREEADEADSPEAEHEAQAAEVFLDNAKAEISNGQSVDEALEAAKSKTLEDLGLEAPEEEPPADIELPNAEIPEPVEPQEPEEPDEIPPPIPVSGATSPPAATPPTPPSPPGGSLPPVPPLGGGGFRGGGALGGPGIAGGNVLPPLPATPNVAPPAPEASVDRRGKGRYLLVGGIVGYMIGRRGGRLRTEAKLLPVQRKLEKEVAELHDKIFWHEASIRSLAHERAVKHPESAEQTAERTKAAKQTKETQPTESKNELLDRFATATERPGSPEALRHDVLKSVDDMTLPELLKIAEQIPIEESNIRRLFEANRLNDEGLRRILKAYLRGESYDKLLHENLIDDSTHERLAQNQPEIAPGLQYDDSQAVRQSVETYAPHAQSLHEKLQQAGADTPAPFAQWAEPEQKQASNNTALIAAVSVAVVVIVLILAFVLA